MSTDFIGGPSIATSQIVTLEVATGARQGPDLGPGPQVLAEVVRRRDRVYPRRCRRETRRPPARQLRVVRHRLHRRPHGRARRLFQLNWSPDGRRIVFHRALDGQWPPVTPTFSRDAVPHGSGRRLSVVFARWPPLDDEHGLSPASSEHHIVMYPDGTDRRVVFETRDQNALAPVWSPAGDRIAFGLGAFFAGGRAGAGAPRRDRRRRIGSAAADQRRRELRLSKLVTGRPAPGRALIGCTGSKGLVIVDVDSGSTTPLTSGPQNDNFPAWSPKGDRILSPAIATATGSSTRSVRRQRLKRLTHSPGNDAHATWSLDGEWIAFASARGGFKDEMPVGEGGGQGAGDIFVMRFDGSDVRQLTDDAFEEATPAFAPRLR